MRVWGYIVLVLGVVFLALFALALMGGARLGFLPWFIPLFLVFSGWTLVKSADDYTGCGGHRATGRPEPSNSRYIAGGLLVFFIGIVVLLAAVDNTPGEGVQLLAWFSGVGLATGLMIVGITWLSTRALAGDKRATFILRTTGPMQLAPMPFGGGAVLRLADRSFLLSGSLKEIGALSTIDSGTVEYSPRGHVALAAWDSRGALRIRLPATQPRTSSQS